MPLTSTLETVEGASKVAHFIQKIVILYSNYYPQSRLVVRESKPYKFLSLKPVVLNI